MNINTYNGWENYETWCVNLWLENEESTYRAIGEMVNDVDTIDELAESIQNFVEELTPDTSGMFSDLLNHALGSVAWDDIAKSWWEEWRNETVYDIDSDLFGDTPMATFAEIDEMVSQWEKVEGWIFDVEESGDELRVYCYRKLVNPSTEYTATPNLHTDWTMVTKDYGYIVVGTEQI